MGFKEWLSEWYNVLFHPFDDLPPEAFMTSQELEELFAATEDEEWND